MTDQWRIDRGITPKVVNRCPTCGVEHKGRCQFMRARKAHRKATVEETRLWLERKRYYQRMRQVQRIIREFCNEIDKARRIARRESSWRDVAQNESGSDIGSDPRKAARNTITRERISEGRPK